MKQKSFNLLKRMRIAGADPGFQVRGGALKKLRRAEGGENFFWVFRVKNHDFTPKNHIFSILGGARAGCDPPSPGSAPELRNFYILSFISSYVKSLMDEINWKATPTRSLSYSNE